MSFWGRVAAVGLGVGGTMLGFPEFAIPAAASIWSADSASDASHRAADTQTRAADQALAQNQRMYDDTNQRQAAVYADSRATFAPFVNLGTSAVGSLGNLLHLPPGNTMSASPPAGAMPSAAPGGAGAYLLDAQGRPTPILAGGGTLLPQVAAQQASQSGYGGGLGNLGGVPMQAPDGSLRTVPAGDVERWERRGAKRAGGAA